MTIPRALSDYMADFNKRATEMYCKIKNHVEILMGDLHEKHHGDYERLLEKHGFTKQQIMEMKPSEVFKQLAEIHKATPPRDPMKELETALELIFEVRYGWTRERVMNMTLPETLIALEHAMEYTPKGKPSVWESTK